MQSSFSVRRSLSSVTQSLSSVTQSLYSMTRSLSSGTWSSFSVTRSLSSVTKTVEDTTTTTLLCTHWHYYTHMVYACLDTCCSHFLTIIAGVDLPFMRESELPVCRTRGMNLVAAVLGEVSNHYINNTLVQISALQYTLWHYNTHISATNSAMLSILTAWKVNFYVLYGSVKKVLCPFMANCKWGF